MNKTFKHGKVEMVLDIESPCEEHRFETVLTKEPETISWLEKVVEPGDTLYDVGANIGLYSLYPYLFHDRNLQVVAFEPVYHNFAKLCKNILKNNANEGIYTYPLALGERLAVSGIDVVSGEVGSACHNVEGTPEEAKENDRVVFRQGAIVFSLDEFVSQFNGPKPNHIKIDTDGFEVAVVEGALQTFISDSVKSVLIEITDVGEAEARIRGCMVERGFHTDHRINIQDNHSRMRREAKGSKIKNVLFVR